MADGPSVGYSTLQVIPSLKGLDKAIGGQLGAPLKAAGEDGGKAASKGFSSGLGGLTKLALPVAGIGAGLFAVGEKFKTAFDTIRVQTGATGATFDKLKQDTKNVLAGTAGSFDQVSAAVGGLYQRTKLTGPALDALAKQQVSLARLTSTDVAGNVESTTSLFNRFGIAAKDQSKSLDVLFKASQQGGKGLGTLIGALQTGAPTLTQFGFGLNKSAALIAGLERAGVNVAPVMSGLRTAFAKIAKEGKNPQKVLAATFKSLKDGKKPTLAMANAIKLFGARGGAELANAVKSGRFSVDKLFKSITDGKDGILETGSAVSTIGGKFAKLKNMALVALEPIASKLVDIANVGMAQVLAAFTKAGPIIAGAWKSILSGFSNPQRQIGPGASAFTRALTTIGVVARRASDAVRGAFGRLVGLLKPVGEGLLASFRSFIPTIQADVRTVVATIRSMFTVDSNRSGAVVAIFRAVREALGGIVGAAVNVGKSVVPVIGRFLKQVVDFVEIHPVPVLVGIGTALGAWAAIGASGDIVSLAQDVRGFTASLFGLGAAEGAASGGLSLVLPAIAAVAAGLAYAYTQFKPVQNAFAAIGRGAQSAFNAVRGIDFSTVFGKVKSSDVFARLFAIVKPLVEPTKQLGIALTHLAVAALPILRQSVLLLAAAAVRLKPVFQGVVAVAYVLARVAGVVLGAGIRVLAVAVDLLAKHLKVLQPVLVAAGTAFVALKAVQGVQAGILGLARVAGRTVGTVQRLGRAAQSFGETLQLSFLYAKDAATSVLNFGKSVATTALNIGRQTAAFLAEKAAAIATAVATKAMAAAQWLLNAAMDANPIGLIVVGIAALAAGFVLAYEHITPFRNAVDFLGRAFVSAFGWVKDHWPLLLAILTGPIGIAVFVVSKNFDRIKGFVSGALDFVRRNWATIGAVLLGPIAIAVELISKNWERIKSGFSAVVGFIGRGVERIVQFFTGLPGRIVGAIGDMSRVLFDIGGEIISGLIDGIKHALGPLGDVLGGVGNFIKDHKGPASKDRKLLTPIGGLIMDGLVTGIRGRMPLLHKQLSAVSDVVAAWSPKKKLSFDLAHEMWADPSQIVAASNFAKAVKAGKVSLNQFLKSNPNSAQLSAFGKLTGNADIAHFLGERAPAAKRSAGVASTFSPSAADGGFGSGNIIINLNGNGDAYLRRVVDEEVIPALQRATHKKRVIRGVVVSKS